MNTSYKVAKYFSSQGSQDCGHMVWSDDNVRSLGENVEDIKVFAESEVR